MTAVNRPPTTITVLGATGLLGELVTTELRARGAEVSAVSRRTGVDAYTGAGLEAALRGATTVVDCLNVTTQSRAKAVDFFSTAAQNVARAAAGEGVGRIVCVSIVSVPEPRVTRVLGYYAGKKAHEDAYRASDVPTTVLRSTQWYELAATFLAQLSAGPFSFVPGMRSRPVAAVDAARFVADQALAVGQSEAAAPGEPAIAGPEILDMADLARAISARRGGRRVVVRVPVGLTALGNGGLLPQGDYAVGPTTFTQWLERRPA